MTENKVKNLISFCFLLHKSMGMNWVTESPDYILEKWNSIIGFEPEEYPYLSIVENDNEIGKWVRKWSVSEDFLKKYLRIIVFIRIINTKSLIQLVDEKIWTLTDLIDTFESHLGEGSISNINEVKYNHIHSLVRGAIEEWLNEPVNSRELSIIKILD